VNFGEEDKGAQNYRFTVKGDVLYVFMMVWPKGNEVAIGSLSASQGLKGKINKVELLGTPGLLPHTQDTAALRVKLPTKPAGNYAYTLKISGLKLD
jgi:alpha-L-fucosidase